VRKCKCCKKAQQHPNDAANHAQHDALDHDGHHDPPVAPSDGGEDTDLAGALLRRHHQGVEHVERADRDRDDGDGKRDGLEDREIAIIVENLVGCRDRDAAKRLDRISHAAEFAAAGRMFDI